MTNPDVPEDKKAEKDANTCIALGVGVAGLGTAAAVVAGAVCPICYIVAPGLIGAGVVQKALAKRKKKKIDIEESGNKK